MKYHYTESPIFMLCRAASTCIHLHKGGKLQIKLEPPIIYRPQSAPLFDSHRLLLIVSLPLYIYVPVEWGELRPVCRLICSGISLLTSSGDTPANCRQVFITDSLREFLGLDTVHKLGVWEIVNWIVWILKNNGKASSHSKKSCRLYMSCHI